MHHPCPFKYQTVKQCLPTVAARQLTAPPDDELERKLVFRERHEGATWLKEDNFSRLCDPPLIRGWCCLCCDSWRVIALYSFICAMLFFYFSFSSLGLFVSSLLLIFIPLLSSCVGPRPRENKCTFSARLALLVFACLLGGLAVAKPQQGGSSGLVITGPPIPASDNPYEACALTINGLSLTEQCFFAAVAYQENPDSDVLAYFNAAGRNVTRTGHCEKPSLWSYREHATNRTFFVARGTWESREWLHDADVWAEAALIQLFSSFTPMGAMPLSALSIFIQLLSSLGGTLGSEAKFLDDAFNWVKLQSEAYPGDSFSFAGHSLGGGTATIVSRWLSAHRLKQAIPQLGIPSVSFSGPGFLLSAAKLNLTQRLLGLTSAQLAAIDALTTVVLPARDLVPRIDYQVGLLQDISCDSTNPVDCHDIKRACKALLYSCGDHFGRSFRS